MIREAALEYLLKGNGVPCVTRNALAAGLAAKIDPAMERKLFFVPYLHYTAVKASEEDFFSGAFAFDR